MFPVPDPVLEPVSVHVWEKLDDRHKKLRPESVYEHVRIPVMTRKPSREHVRAHKWDPASNDGRLGRILFKVLCSSKLHITADVPTHVPVFEQAGGPMQFWK